MISSSLSVIILFVSILLGTCEYVSTHSDPALFIISFDGFRPDYLHRNVTPNLNKFRREGTSARYMNPVFPTKTFVNHFTIATGLYPGKHGVLANSLYDSHLGEEIGYSYELFHYNESTIPIWTANEMAGKHSGCMWPGSDYEYNGISCTFTKSFDPSITFEDRIDLIMKWFTHDETPASLVMLYIEEPDGRSHVYGPESIQITNDVARVDRLTRYIQNRLIDNNLIDKVNVIHLSDHGMVGVNPPKFINISEFIENSTYDIYGSSPVLQIVPKNKSYEYDLFMNLTRAADRIGHFKVYNQEKLPSRRHANNLWRMGPIITVADSGYAFQDLMRAAKIFEQKYNITITNETKYGVHGYDNADPTMRAVFMAKGPLFAKGRTLRPINAIDLYNLFCYILQIECGENDGSTELSIWDKLFAVSKTTD